MPIRGLERISSIVSMESVWRLKLCPPLGVPRHAEIVNGKPAE